MAHQITNLKATNSKAKTHQVRQGYNANHWVVESGSSGKQYHVSLEPLAACTCEWAKYRPEGTACGCSHVQAVLEFVAELDGYKATIRLQSESTAHLHRKTEQVGDGIKVTLRKTAEPKKPEPTGEQIDEWFSY